MSITRALLATLATGLSYVAVEEVQKSYPSSLPDLSQNTVVTNEQEISYYIVGCHGTTPQSAQSMQENGLLAKDIFIGPPETAQYYGKVVVVLGTRVRPVVESDYRPAGALAMKGIGMHQPLTKEAVEKLAVEVIQTYPVNLQTRVGLLASVQRAVHSFFQADSKPLNT